MKLWHWITWLFNCMFIQSRNLSSKTVLGICLGLAVLLESKLICCDWLQLVWQVVAVLMMGLRRIYLQLYMTGLWKYHAGLVRPGPISFRTSWNCFQEKPADQDPYWLQELIYIWFHTVFERIICWSTERYETNFFSFGQVKFSMDKYILAFYLPLDQ